MCGRMNVIDSPEVRQLLDILGIKLYTIQSRPDIAPTEPVQIVRQTDNGRQLITADKWFLFLHDDKPNHPKYLQPNWNRTSFNTRAARFYEEKYEGADLYRVNRCGIPVSAFVEGLGDNKTYHQITLESSAVLLGGLFKEYVNKNTGEVITTASVITLPPLKQWATIHPKSMPLILPYHDCATMDKWFDPAFHQVEEFDDLLVPRVNETQVLTPIDRPKPKNPIGPSFKIDP